MTNRQILLVSRPTGEPTRDNFKLIESPIAPLAEGQLLVRHHYLSLDPYMRGRMNDAKSYAPPQPLNEVMIGGTAGEVVESEDVGALEAAVGSCNKEFVVTSPSFDDGDALPYESTCEGQAFSSGASPKLHWKAAPRGTKSYALVLKDLSLVETLPNRAYHWVAWDIPSSVTSLP
jgi:hypothetical protein